MDQLFSKHSDEHHSKVKLQVHSGVSFFYYSQAMTDKFPAQEFCIFHVEAERVVAIMEGRVNL